MVTLDQLRKKEDDITRVLQLLDGSVTLPERHDALVRRLNDLNDEFEIMAGQYVRQILADPKERS